METDPNLNLVRTLSLRFDVLYRCAEGELAWKALHFKAIKIQNDKNFLCEDR